MADIFGGFSCIRFAGYLEVREVPATTRGTPICMRYVIFYGVPLIVQGTSIYTGYLKSCRAPRIMQGTSDCADIIPLADTWRSITFPIFPSNNIPLVSFWREVLEAKETHCMSDMWRRGWTGDTLFSFFP